MNRLVALLAIILATNTLQVGSAPLENETQERTNICGGTSGAQETTKWPRNIVPYTIGSNFAAFDRTSLINSIHHLENITCVLFIPRTSEEDYVFFKMSTRCCSHYGKIGQGKQEVYFSERCLQEGASINRVLQALIGDVDTSPQLIAENDSGTHNNLQNQPQATDVASSQMVSECANSCSKRILLQPPSGENSTSSSGVISSPNYPNHYPSHSDCAWKVIAPNGYFISLKFQADMDIEVRSQDICKFDYLDLFLLDAWGEQLTNTSRFCGRNSASMLNSALGSSAELQTQAVIAHFHSDDTHTGEGFQLNYTLQANHSELCSVNNGRCCREGYTLAEDGHSCLDVDECERKYKEGGCQQRCTNSVGSYQCFCRPGFRLAEDGRDCLECGGIFNNSQGVIESRNFPFPYPAEQNCKWTVLAWPDHHIRVSVVHMDILPSNRCKVDFLKVEKGHFPNQRRLCGYYSNITYVVEDSIYFRFRSRDSSTYYDGFRLEYSQLRSSELSDLESKFVTINNK